MDENQQACLSLLRAGDRDRYLCALLTPDDIRGTVAALYAFNLEIARVRDLVTEPMMGAVRLQWWKDLIAGQSHGDASSHPVAAALMAAVKAGELPRQTLIDMIEAREFDLYDDPMPDRNTFEGYAGETASALIQLAAQLLDADRSAAVATAAGHAGVTQLVSGLLLLMPIHRARGQVYVPREILTAAGLDRDAFLAGNDGTALEQALSAFVALGQEHLGEARGSLPAVAPSCFAAFLPVATAAMVFDRAEKLGAAIFERPPVIAQWRRQTRFWNAARKQQI